MYLCCSDDFKAISSINHFQELFGICQAEGNICFSLFIAFRLRLFVFLLEEKRYHQCVQFAPSQTTGSSRQNIRAMVDRSKRKNTHFTNTVFIPPRTISEVVENK